MSRRARSAPRGPTIRLRYHDAAGMYGLKRYSLDLLAALQGIGVDARPSPARIREARIAGRAIGGLVTKRLSNLLPPIGSGLVHCTDHHSQPTIGRADVVTVHDIIPTTHPDLVARGAARAAEDAKAVRRAVGQSSAIVAATAAVRDDLVRHYAVPADLVHVVHHGLDPARFHPGPAVPHPAFRKGRLNVVVAMNADLRKRVDVVLAAAAAVPEANIVHVGRLTAAPDVTRRLASLEGLEEAARRLEAEGRYHRLGHVDDATLRGLYATADVVAHPSVVEGFSLPPLEALACGADVLASDIPVHREVLGDAATLLPLEPGAWARALSARAAGRSRGTPRTRRLAHAARYSWPEAARRYAAVYEAVA